MEDDPAVHRVAPDHPASPPTIEALAARIESLERQVASLSDAFNLPFAAPTIPRSESITPAVEPASSPPPPPFVFDTAPPDVAAPQRSLETRLGSQVFNLIGIVALIFGASWALKLAIEHGLLGPAARILIGLGVGAGIILWSEAFRKKSLAAFCSSLKAVGTGILYLSLWAAFQLYNLFPAPVALGAMVLVTAWNAFMALTQDDELIAAYALIGGLLTPVLLSTGGDHETFLFSYLACIVAAVVYLQRTRPWSRLLIPTFLAVAAYFTGYYSSFFHNSRLREWDTQSTETAVYLLIFGTLFALFSTRWWARETYPTPGPLTPVLIPLANAAFVAFALYSIFQDSGQHAALPWLMAALAAVYLGLMRLQGSPLAAAIHLACAVVFLTIAIPLKLSGHSLTTAWLVEGLVLYWASTRFQAEGDALDGKSSSQILSVLAAAGYALGLASVLAHWTWNWTRFPPPDFFNANLGSALVAVTVLAGAAWLAHREQSALLRIDLRVFTGALSAIVAVALLLTLREIAAASPYDLLHPAFANPDFATALVGLSLIAAVAWFAHSEYRQYQAGLVQLLSAVSLVLFNLVALLTGVREISALWPRTGADLQRSLAISAFLMVYGAALLTAGFLRRNAFVRWQALILLLFTIAKVFLYDISGLSAGYRVASFLALGVLLLTVSYAYQKDWLSLKTPPPLPSDGERV